jgi:uncharacterized MAPEG superfamily protein
VRCILCIILDVTNVRSFLWTHGIVSFSDLMVIAHSENNYSLKTTVLS